jgi:hypothetical protein
MTDQTKFEEMLEKLVNEDREGAEALFHEIVVEKSREIYTNILDEADDEEVEETTDEEVDESDDEDLDETTDEEVEESDDEDLDESDDEDLDEMFGLNEPEMEAEHDPAMDMMGDMEPEMAPDMGDDDGDDEGEADSPEAAMDNLEDALEELKAAFADMMGDDEPGNEEPGEEEPEEEAFAYESADEEVEEAADEEVEEAADEEVEETKTPKTASETMREYVEKIADPSNTEGADNKKSTVAGKNDMGGTAGNLNQGQDGNHPEAGAGSTVQGSALSDTSAKEENAGNVNVPGGKASKSMKSQPGHGAEKKGKPENAANKKSMTGS